MRFLGSDVVLKAAKVEKIWNGRILSVTQNVFGGANFRADVSWDLLLEKK
ncbi:MAG: hypothetical protein HFH25_02920 [Lachnospiraceae bacterium]|nr:hypothetical protein [Lachnospiraceae bacterium]